MDISTPTSVQRASLLALLPQGDSTSPRDAFIQSQTGSGKTLSYLLPILHDLLPMSTNSYIDRSIGTLAIIVAPTRELAKQISDVLDVLLKLRLRPLDAAPDDEMNDTRLTRWLVSGLLTGGATRTHEKARRLLDHLQNTSTFDVSKCRWLVLDEADRLMELGFADTIKGILACVNEGRSMEVRGWDWVRPGSGWNRLTEPIIVKATEADLPNRNAETGEDAAIPAAEQKFTPPSQLSQKYIVVPLKLRLVTLGWSTGFQDHVFFSCTDSVDFHWRLLGGCDLEGDGGSLDSDDEATGGEDGRVGVHSPLLPETSIFRLHGSLPLSTRLSSLRTFSAAQKAPESSHLASILLCTSVAARGLDLPRVRAVVQYDLPTEGGATEYVHRVGRTARAGRGGQAWAIVAPSEAQWVEWVQARMERGTAKGGAGRFESVAAEEILQTGFGGQGKEYEDRATEVQLAFERWCLRRKENAEMARSAFASHLRAYATHPSDEKHIFHIRNLHLGHLAKSFALRETPSTVSGRGEKARGGVGKKRQTPGRRPKRGRGDESGEDDPEAERRMRAAVRSQGRLVKKGGAMASSGLSEFQVASGDALERLVNKTQFRTM
ncbi:hypothetical protein EI94DRAFT_1745716 [Lactarius quietus]|nr:hypothetical protein EI94DRAFT_1745716 [Lactarius quietus]